VFDLVPKPQFTVVVPPKLLQEGYLVYFTAAWPSTLLHVRDKLFRVDAVNQVPFFLEFKVPTGDYKDVDISNASTGEKLYPTRGQTLFEVALGFKPGNFVATFFIPSGKSLSQLEYAGMYPDPSSATKVYIGGLKPSDSPYDDPRVRMYFPMDVAPLIIRLFVLPGVDFEKCVLGLTVNKCFLREIANPTPEQKLKAKVIRYFDEQRW